MVLNNARDKFETHMGPPMEAPPLGAFTADPGCVFTHPQVVPTATPAHEGSGNIASKLYIAYGPTPIPLQEVYFIWGQHQSYPGRGS